MQEHRHERIVQIIPALGWVAVYAGKISGDIVFTVPLVCWAVVESNCKENGCHEKQSEIHGMTAEEYVDVCELETNFLGYARSTEDPVVRYGYAARNLLAKFNGQYVQESKPERQ